MVVWSASLNSPDDKETAIICDVEFIHTNAIVHNCIVTYGVAIHQFLNNPQTIDANRIDQAYNVAHGLASTSLNKSIEVDNEEFSAKAFLETAKDLS